MENKQQLEQNLKQKNHELQKLKDLKESITDNQKKQKEKLEMEVVEITKKIDELKKIETQVAHNQITDQLNEAKNDVENPEQTYELIK
jgi:ribosomal protein L9